MKAADIHYHHTVLNSEILFLKKELDFLLKILRNCYSSSANVEKIKLMDSYWKSFERNIEALDKLMERIRLEEKLIAGMSHATDSDLNKDGNKERVFDQSLHNISYEIKLLKESFYEFMHGCNACALKANANH